MSLTGPDHLFAGVHENGANDLLRAFFLARPHYLHYGSPPFVTTTTISETLMSPIPFPGTGGIGWLVEFAIPVVDFDPDSSGGGMPPQLTLGPGQLSIHTRVRLCVQCGSRKGGNGREPVGHGKEPPANQGKVLTPLCTALDVWAVGGAVAHYFSPGVGDITFHLDAVELVDVTPDSLETMLECLIRMMLQAALDQVHLPFHALTAGAFSLALTRGPEISNDMLQLWGTL